MTRTTSTIGTIRRNCKLLAAFVLTSIAWSAPASAQPIPTLPPAESEESLIDRAIKLREKNDDEGALQLLQQAQAIANSGRAVAQVALAEQALGRWVHAEAHLREALTRNDPWIARNKPLLEQALRDIQGHLGWLRLAGGVSGAEVLLNGQPAGQLPLAEPLRAVAGRASLEVRAAGYQPAVRTVTIPAGGTADETVAMAAIVVPVASPGPGSASGTTVAGSEKTIVAGPTNEKGTSWSPRRKVAIGLAVGGGISLATGVILTTARNGAADDYNKAGCATTLPNHGPAGCADEANTTSLLQTLSIVGYVGAIAFAGASVFFFASDHARGGTGTTPGAVSIRCAPSLGAGVACAGMF
jgi:hypothetical protein